jgi:hypothetical protein
MISQYPMTTDLREFWQWYVREKRPRIEWFRDLRKISFRLLTWMLVFGGTFLAYVHSSPTDKRFFRLSWTDPFFLSAMLVIWMRGIGVDYFRTRLEQEKGVSGIRSPYQATRVPRMYRDLFGKRDSLYRIYTLLMWLGLMCFLFGAIHVFYRLPKS